MTVLKKGLVAVLFSSSLVVAMNSAHAELVIDDNTTVSSFENINEQQPTDESVNKLIEVINLEDSMHIMDESGMMDSMLNSIFSSATANLEGREKEQLTNLLMKFTKDVMDGSKEKLFVIYRDSFAQVVKKHYTQEEVDAQIAFYSTDIGKSVISKQTDVMSEYMTLAMPQAIEVMQETMLNALPAYQEEIERLHQRNRKTKPAK